MVTDEQLISALQEAADPDGSLSYHDFSERTDHSARTIQRHFGSWNEGKKEAGLDITEEASKGSPPDIFDITQDEWEELSSQMRGMYRRQAKSWAIQLERGCAHCGYDDHPSALDWHHTDPDDKTKEVSRIIHRNGWEAVEKEIEKCEVLCANCHRIEGDNRYDCDE